ncbi:hypothetical protein EV1_005787 [Malus domestica]
MTIELKYEFIVNSFKTINGRGVNVHVHHCKPAGNTNIASKPFVYGYHHTQCLRQSVSSSSMDVSIVPDDNTMTDDSNPYNKSMTSAVESSHPAVQLSSADREARVLRYREKRKSPKPSFCGSLLSAFS